MTFLAALSTIGIKSCDGKTTISVLLIDWTCRLPEGEHKGFHGPKTERNIVLAGFWR